MALCGQSGGNRNDSCLKGCLFSTEKFDPKETLAGSARIDELLPWHDFDDVV